MNKATKYIQWHTTATGLISYFEQLKNNNIVTRDAKLNFNRCAAQLYSSLLCLRINGYIDISLAPHWWNKLTPIQLQSCSTPIKICALFPIIFHVQSIVFNRNEFATKHDQERQDTSKAYFSAFKHSIGRYVIKCSRSMFVHIVLLATKPHS